MRTVQITTVLQFFFLSVIFVDTCQNYSTTWIVHYKHTGSSMITDCYLINDILSLITKLSSTIRFHQHPIHRTKFPSPQRTFLPCMILPWSVHRDIWNYSTVDMNEGTGDWTFTHGISHCELGTGEWCSSALQSIKYPLNPESWLSQAQNR